MCSWITLYFSDQITSSWISRRIDMLIPQNTHTHTERGRREVTCNSHIDSRDLHLKDLFKWWGSISKVYSFVCYNGPVRLSYNRNFSACLFSAGTVFFSHHKLAGTVLRLVFSAKRTGPINEMRFKWWSCLRCPTMELSHHVCGHELSSESKARSRWSTSKNKQCGSSYEAIQLLKNLQPFVSSGPIVL